MKKTTINFGVQNIKETVHFYEETLGFNLVMAVSETKEPPFDKFQDDIEYVYAMVSSGAVEIMFQRFDSLKEDLGEDFGVESVFSGTVYIETENIEEFYKSVESKIKITKELNTTWYGMKEFYIKDCNGYILCFAQKSDN